MQAGSSAVNSSNNLTWFDAFNSGIWNPVDHDHRQGSLSVLAVDCGIKSNVVVIATG